MKSPLSIRRLLGLSESKAKLGLQGAAAGTQDPKIIAPTSTSTKKGNAPLPIRQLLTWPVVIAAGNYAVLAIVDITLRAVQPVFLSTPIRLGGLGLSPQTIGVILSGYGILNGLLQIFFFAKIHDRFGSKRVYLTGIFSSLPVFLLFPIINILARHQGYSLTVWFAVALQCCTSIVINFSYGKVLFRCFFFIFRKARPLKNPSCLPRFRLCVYLHHRFVSQQSVPGIGKWTRADERVYHALRWACCCQFTLLILD